MNTVIAKIIESILGGLPAVAGSLVLLPLLTSVADAQPATPAEPVAGDGSLEVVIVTATKQGERNLQDVAASVQVFTSASLQEQDIQGFDDYSRLVPSLSSINQGPGQTQIVMRGVTTGRINHSQPQNKSTTGLYIDEIPISSGAFNPDLALFDVDRIEILRGPQGTLYGAGAMSGAIRILTREPEFGLTEGLAEVTGSSTKSGGGNYAARGLFNQPIGSNAALRVSGYYEENSGYIDNVYTGREDYNSDRTYGGRASLKFGVGERFDLNVNLLHQNLETEGRPDEFLPADPALYRRNTPSERFLVSGDYQVVKFLPDPFEDQFTILNGVLEGDVGFARLTSSTSLFKREAENALDDTYRNRTQQGPTLVDRVSGVFTPFYNDTDTDQIANETRLASPLGDKLEWVAGVFVSRQDDDFVQSAPEVGLDALLQSFGLPPSVAFGTTEPNNVFQGSQTIEQTQFAGFGEVTVNTSDKVSVLLGLRAFDFKQDFDLRYAGIANDGVTTTNTSTNDSGVNPKVQVNLRATDTLLLYAQAAEGFRLGGVNEPVPLVGVLGTNCSADLAQRGLLGLPPAFGSDSLRNYELGFKKQTESGKATLNMAAYQIDWDDIQTSVFLPCSFTTVVNAGEARIRGFETEFRLAPVDNVVLALSGSYTDAEMVETGPQFDAMPGDRLPNVPRLLLSASIDYTHPMSGNSDIYLRANIQRQTESFSDFERLPTAFEVPAFTSGDLFAGYRREGWDVSLFIRNFTDERIVTAVDSDRTTPVTYTVARPRTIGVTGRMKF